MQPWFHEAQLRNPPASQFRTFRLPSARAQEGLPKWGANITTRYQQY
jgi:hypothetical protein